MRVGKILLFIFIGCFILTANGISQQFAVGLSGGYAKLTGPAKYTQDFLNGGMGFRHAFEIGGQVKYKIKNTRFHLAAFANYFKTSGSGKSFKPLPLES